MKKIIFVSLFIALYSVIFAQYKVLEFSFSDVEPWTEYIVGKKILSINPLIDKALHSKPYFASVEGDYLTTTYKNAVLLYNFTTKKVDTMFFLFPDMEKVYGTRWKDDTAIFIIYNPKLTHGYQKKFRVIKAVVKNGKTIKKIKHNSDDCEVEEDFFRSYYLSVICPFVGEIDDYDIYKQNYLAYENPDGTYDLYSVSFLDEDLKKDLSNTAVKPFLKDNLLFYITSDALVKYDLQTKEKKILHTFDETTEVFGPAFDENFFVYAFANPSKSIYFFLAYDLDNKSLTKYKADGDFYIMSASIDIYEDFSVKNRILTYAVRDPEEPYKSIMKKIVLK